MVQGKYLLLFVVLVTVRENSCQGNHPPIWQDETRLFIVSETQTSFSYLMRATDLDANDVLSYGLIGQGPFAVDASSGIMSLTGPLDYELHSSYNFTATVSDGTTQIVRDIYVIVTDANDHPPVFSVYGDTFNISVPQGLQVGSVVFANLEVRDVDSSNDRLQVTCTGDQTACSDFEIIESFASNQYWGGYIALAKSLSFDPANPCKEFSLRAFDGIFETIEASRVCLVTESGSPPVFTSSLTGSIFENTAQGIVVFVVQAEDPDQTAREIHYSLASNPGDLFSIDAQTGNISTVKTVIRQNIPLQQSVISVGVRATEVVDGYVYNSPSLASTVDITFSILSTRKHAPTFSQQNFVAEVNENVAPLTAIPDLSLSVSDLDQGINGQFNLTLASHGNIFVVQPAQAVGSTNARILVANPDAIDYETTSRQYTLFVIATESQGPDALSGTATVVVNIKDENDNPPRFGRNSYSASVQETAAGGTPIITITASDLDSGINGNPSLRYRIIGNGASRFTVGKATGVVSVARCSTPGSGNCLDAEVKQQYDLTFEAWDRYGEGRSASVPLTITLLNSNDNPPVFLVDEVTGYIQEGETQPNPSITVQADDADNTANGSPLVYDIISQFPSTPTNLWRIDRRTGRVEATQPVPYPDPPGFYELTIRASDGINEDTMTLIIEVRDINNNSPVFTDGGYYTQSIAENTPPGTVVYTVFARDDDPSDSPNGQVAYRIATGANDLFVVNSTTGKVTVAPGATFDVRIDDTYTLRVLAADQGVPQRSAEASLVITIRDVNNRSPYFSPSSVTTSVNEDALNGTSVVRMAAQDPDVDAQLEYSLINITATDQQGQEVNPNQVNFQTWFRIEPSTGVVRVDGVIDIDLAAAIQAKVKAEDINATSDQFAYGTLVINILEINTEAPVFSGGWSPSLPYINLTMAEERPPNSVVTVIQATDPNNRISGYGIESNPGNHLKIDDRTGELRIARRVDYENTQELVAVVVATDTGDPQLTSTATLVVDVININDNPPVFDPPLYEVSLPENSPAGTLVANVNATDLDDGDFGVVRYHLLDALENFEIDSVSGVIRVRDGANLDRESTPLLTLSVRAQDSPANASLSLSSFVQVLVTVEDVNDSPPMFAQSPYYASVFETVPINTEVIQVTAVDLDLVSNITYSIVSGNNQGLFQIDGSSGIVRTNASLTDTAAVYNLTLMASDTGSLNSTVLLIVSIPRGNKWPPHWIHPPYYNWTYHIPENELRQVADAVVYRAYDNDTDSYAVTYGFLENNTIVQETPDFTIDNLTGLVTPKHAFDREQQAIYPVMLAATDNGLPPLTSYTLVSYIIDNVNDNIPQFPADESCCAVPVTMTAREDAPLQSVIGQVEASDPDQAGNDVIIYAITSGNEDETFAVDPLSGTVTLRKELDYAEKPRYEIVITASDPGLESQPTAPAQCTCDNSSSVRVFIHVNNTNNSPPTFPQNTYNSCIALNAEIDTLIERIPADDNDGGLPSKIRYSLVNLTAFDTDDNEARAITDDIFRIEPDGAVYNSYLMNSFEDYRFDMDVLAKDDPWSAQAPFSVWVVAADTEVTLTAQRRLEDVEQDIDNIKRAIMEKTNWGVVCVTSIRYHLTEGGIVNRQWTDIRLHVVDGSTRIVYTTEALLAVLDMGFLRAHSLSSIKASYGFWDGFNIDPVLGAVIAIILLLLLALLLLCCLWCICLWCCADEEERMYVVPEMVNPIWKKRFYEDQELVMAVPEADLADDATITVRGSYDNPTYVSSSANGTVQRDVIVKKEETSYELSAVQQQLQHDVVDAREMNGHVTSEPPRIETSLVGNSTTIIEKKAVSTALDIPIITVAPPKPSDSSLVSSTMMTDGALLSERNHRTDGSMLSDRNYRTDGTMRSERSHLSTALLSERNHRSDGSMLSERNYRTDGTMRSERSQLSANEAQVTGFSSESFKPLSGRVGAKLSRSTTPPYANGYNAYSSLPYSAVDQVGGSLRPSAVSSYEMDVDEQHLSTGIRTENLLTPNMSHLRNASDTRLAHDDLRSELSTSPSWMGEEYHDELYQGEIHLGTVYSNPPSVYSGR